jgi:hypothetical protein
MNADLVCQDSDQDNDAERILLEVGRPGANISGSRLLGEDVCQ